MHGSIATVSLVLGEMRKRIGGGEGEGEESEEEEKNEAEEKGACEVAKGMVSVRVGWVGGRGFGRSAVPHRSVVVSGFGLDRTHGASVTAYRWHVYMSLARVMNVGLCLWLFACAGPYCGSFEVRFYVLVYYICMRL